MGDLLFKNKYRVPSARLTDWDYSAGGFYFVTVCVKQHECIFGGINNGVMCLNRLGAVVYKCWKEIPQHFPFVRLGEFVVMPNHVHGILEICENKNLGVGVETQNIASLQTPYKNKFGPQSKNLSSIVRGFKIGVTKYTNQNNIDFQWLSRFHDHIIRNEQSLYNIRKYTINNPANWRLDKFFN